MGSQFKMDRLTPEFFDILIILNIVVGLVIAGRRFRADIRGPMPDEAPDWARATKASALSSRQDS